MINLKDKVAIVGIGCTEFSKNSGRSELVLALEAIKAAVEDAGLTPKDIDGLVRWTYDSTAQEYLSRNLGIPELTFWADIPMGGVTTGTAVASAASAIITGQANVVVCYRAMNERSGVRFGREVEAEDSAVAHRNVIYRSGDKTAGGAFSAPYGYLSFVQGMAMWARRYMYMHGLDDDQMSQILGKICVTQRAYANRNPNAMMRDKLLSMEDYLHGRMISSPFRLFDCCLETDGACAIVLVSAERAKDLRQRPVYVLGAGQAFVPYGEPVRTYARNIPYGLSDAAVKRLYDAAGITPADVDVACLYEVISMNVVLRLEDFKFCKHGEAGDFIKAGNLGPDGKLPTNTHGGHLSEGYIQGMNHTVEAVRQLRGTAANQVPNAEIAMVTSAVDSWLILRR